MSRKSFVKIVALFLRNKGIDPEKISGETSTDCGRKIKITDNVLFFTFKEETKELPLAEVISAYKVA